jgi:hypothetical protein
LLPSIEKKRLSQTFSPNLVLTFFQTSETGKEEDRKSRKKLLKMPNQAWLCAFHFALKPGTFLPRYVKNSVTPLRFMDNPVA